MFNLVNLTWLVVITFTYDDDKAYIIANYDAIIQSIPPLLLILTVWWIRRKINAFNSVHLKVKDLTMKVHMILCIILIT